jgi:hypothetical protein
VVVGEDQGVLLEVRRLGTEGEAVWSAVVGQAVVGASFATVDLLPGRSADVVYEDPTRAGLDVEGEGVVFGDESVPVYPYHLAEKGVQGLRVSLGVLAGDVVPDGCLELAVLPEVQGPAVVVGGRVERRRG